MNLPSPVTPLGLAALTVNVIVAPLIGWLVKSGRKAARKLTMQGIRLTALEGKVLKLEKTCEATEPRVARLENAIRTIEKATEQSAVQHAAVMQRLEQLPRLAALLEAYSSAIAAIVPRPEVDGKITSVEQRLLTLETDIRRGAQ